MVDVESLLNGKSSKLHVVEAGKVSDTYLFEDNGQKLIIRVTDEAESYRRDRLAAELFRGSVVPVPDFLDYGKLADGRYYAVTEYVSGVSSDMLRQDELDEIIPEIWDIFAAVFSKKIEGSTGYGHLDSKNNGQHKSWRDAISSHLREKSGEEWRDFAAKAGLDTGLIDKFRRQLEVNLGFVPDSRHLLHGDPGFDNMLIDKRKVTAVIGFLVARPSRFSRGVR